MITPLEPMIAAAKQDGGLIELQHGEFSLSAAAVITKTNLTIRAPIDAILHCPTAGPCWEPLGTGFTLDGFTVPRAGKYFIPGPSSVLQNTIIQQANQIVWTTTQSDNFIGRKIKNGVTMTVSYWCDHSAHGFLLEDVESEGSYGEYNVRFSSYVGPDGKNVIPQNVRIVRGVFSNRKEVTNKPTIGWRNAFGSIVGATVCQTVRLGQQNQGPSINPGDYVRLTMNGCTFLENTPGGPYIGVYTGADLGGRATMLNNIKRIPKLSTVTPVAGAVSLGSIVPKTNGVLIETGSGLRYN